MDVIDDRLLDDLAAAVGNRHVIAPAAIRTARAGDRSAREQVDEGAQDLLDPANIMNPGKIFADG